jgi:cytochrome c oxidase subunit 2
VLLRDGRVTADAAYLRESILKPRAKLVAGWEPIMPSYANQLADPTADVGEEEAMIRLIAYLQSLSAGEQIERMETFPPPPAQADLSKPATK